MDNNNNKQPNAKIAFIGAAFFAVPYLFLGASFFSSLLIGGFAYYGASLLSNPNAQNAAKEVLYGKNNTKQKTTSSNKTPDVNPNLDANMKKIISTAKGQNQLILSMMYKVEDEQLKENIVEVNKLAAKIIEAVEAKPEKYDKANSFFNYYLPTTLKILARYDDIENQRLDSAESKKFMDDIEAMIIKIRKSFKKQLTNLYTVDMIDTDAELKVFEQMLNSDGITTNDDFNLKK